MFYSDASLSKCSLLLFSFSRSSSQEFQNNPPELLTINLVPCVSVGTIQFVWLLTFQLNCVCRSFFMTSKSFLRKSSKHNLLDLSCFPFLFSKPQFVFSRHNKISPLLLSRLTLNSESTPCLFVAVLL